MNLSHPIRITGVPRQHGGRLRGDARLRADRRRRRPGIEGLEGRQLLAAKSLNVGIIGGPTIENGGTLPTTGTDVAGFNFTTVDPATFDATTLASFDTLVLNVTALPNQSLTALSAAQKADLVSFVGNGGKLIIYDSESPAQNYDWLPYTFSTNNPGQQGAQGTLSFSESNTLANDNSATPSFVDVNYLSSSTDAVGDANVFVSNDSHWCATLSALNTTGTYGATLAYATYSTSSTTQGLFIYNGLDQDYLGAESSADGLRKIWVNELNQGFNPVSTTDLPCAAPVTGIKLEPATATNQIGATHTVTATLQDLGGSPQVGVHVTFTITGANASATQTISPAGGLSDANGVVTMTYTGTVIGTDTITASFVNSNNQTIMSTPVTATWTAPNTTPPVSVDKTFYTHADTTLSVPINGVLANDTDPDPSHTPLLQAIQVSAPSHGTLTLQSNGSFVYVPNAGFVGQDSFQYKAFDGQETGNTATVTLTVFQPLTIGMSQASDSGVSNTDQITNINTPVFQARPRPARSSRSSPRPSVRRR